jgi:hypothetical protein
MAQNGSRSRKINEDDDDTPHRLSDCNLVHVRGSEKQEESKKKIARQMCNAKKSLSLLFLALAFHSERDDNR